MGPEARSTAVVTPPWTSRRHGGAPETYAVARWATAAGRPRHRHPCRHRTRYAARKVPAPTSPVHVTTSRGVETVTPCAPQPGWECCRTSFARPSSLRPGPRRVSTSSCSVLVSSALPRHVPLSAAPASRRLPLRARQQCACRCAPFAPNIVDHSPLRWRCPPVRCGVVASCTVSAIPSRWSNHPPR